MRVGKGVLERIAYQRYKRYTLGEEIFNAVSHGIGALLSIAGMIVLIVIAARNHDPWAVVASSIYGASLIDFFPDCRHLYARDTRPPAWLAGLGTVRHCLGRFYRGHYPQFH